MRVKGKTTHEAKATLLDREATGGLVASKGLRFQENVALANVPNWLANHRFASVVIEGISDIDAKFFRPKSGEYCELTEVKDHIVTPNEFWAEVDHFKALDVDSPNTYHRFTLCCEGLAPTISAIGNALSRIRGTEDFYADFPVSNASLDEFSRMLGKNGRSSEDAQFLLEHVFIDMTLSAVNNDAESVFGSRLVVALPAYDAITKQEERAAFQALKALFASKPGQPISRQEIENALRSSISATRLPNVQPIHLHTSVQENDLAAPCAIQFDWSQFSGGPTRSLPTASEWDSTIISQLQTTKVWLTRYFAHRRLLLTGKRRLSASVAIGAVFSSVSGFALETSPAPDQANWCTDAHADVLTPPYSLTKTETLGKSNDLIVSLGILQNIQLHIDDFANASGLSASARLHLHGDQPVVSAQQANQLVLAVKRVIRNALAQTDATVIHLFLACPSFIALLLGHRLNAISVIQCYEWVNGKSYTPSCRLTQAL